MDKCRIDYWPAHLRSVFAAVGKTMGDKRLVPDMLGSIPSTRGRIVAGHSIAIRYASGKRAGLRTGRYVVSIAGPRINADWQFRPFELERLSRLVSRSLGRSGEANRYEVGIEVW
jgi:hypothetical protein